MAKVYIWDWMEEKELEEKVLDGVATVECLRMDTATELPTEKLANAEALLVWHLRGVNAEDLTKMPKLKLISRIGVGFDNVDLKAAGERGIWVSHVPDYGVEEVADSTLCHLLNLMRKTHSAWKATTQGSYPTHSVHGSTRVRGLTLGIVGIGKIGTAVAQRAKPFGLNIQFYDPNVVDGYEKSLGVGRVDSLEDLLKTSDIISLHCWLDETNAHMINTESLKHVKRGSYLINTARGGLVDEKALIVALKDGRIKAAALDVQEKEPYTGPLLEMDNVMVTPHVAFYSDQSFAELRTKAALEVKRVLENGGGEPRNPVNKQFMTKK